jgi:hypothetical protein
MQALKRQKERAACNSVTDAIALTAFLAEQSRDSQNPLSCPRYSVQSCHSSQKTPVWPMQCSSPFIPKAAAKSLQAPSCLFH